MTNRKSNAEALLAALVPVTQETADMSDPRQHFAWALAYFPSPNQDMPAVPIQPSVRPLLSELLDELGFAHDPAKQRKWLIPGDHPEAGWLNTPRLVDRNEYDEWTAARGNPVSKDEELRAAAEKALRSINPEMARQIAEMTPEQREQALQEQRESLPAALERLAELAEGDKQ